VLNVYARKTASQKQSKVRAREEEQLYFAEKRNGAERGTRNGFRHYRGRQETSETEVPTVKVKQVTHFKSGGGNPICVGLVGINFADQYVSFEGRKRWPTDGKRYKHPIQEAAHAEQRLLAKACWAFDEFQILRFRAMNTKPFPFEWVDLSNTELEYSALLTRVSREYDKRFS
jgi:hypothetical protein